MKIFSFPKRGKSISSFEQLLRPHIEHLYRIAYRFTGAREDAEDLVQDLLVKLYPRRAELSGIERLRPWLTTSIYRLFVDNVRRYTRSPVHLVNDEGGLYESTASSDPQPEQELERKQYIEHLQLAFERLSNDHRVLLVLHDIEGYSLVELEQMLESPLGTLKSRIHRARRRLRDLLKNGG